MSELVDLVNSRGEIKLRAIPRHEVGDYPDLHMQIVIVIALDSMKRVLIHRRSTQKEVDPQKYDHICGVIRSDEDPKDAAIREGQEETGLLLTNIRKVREGLNQYGRWCHLMVARAEGEPSITDPNEVEWVGYLHPEELRQKQAAGQEFVDEFFEDLELITELEKYGTPQNRQK